MIKANGKVQKKVYCPHCNSIISWDGTNDEFNFSGHRMITCPFCKNNVNLSDAMIKYVEIGIIENPKAYIDGVAYETTTAAIANLKAGDTLTLMEDVTLTSLNLVDANIDLNGHTIAISTTIYPEGKVTLSNGTINTTANSDSIVAGEGVEITLDNISITSKRNGVDAAKGKIILNNASVNAQEAAILVLDGGTVEINGGTYTTIDNGPIMTNGSAGRGKNTIIVNDGEFTGHITSAGYLAFVVYLANDDTLIVNGGTFNVENGSAFIVRGGHLYIKPEAIISTSGTATGKVGDGQQLIPAGHDIVIDYKSQYPAVESIKVNAPDRDIHIIETE